MLEQGEPLDRDRPSAETTIHLLGCDVESHSYGHHAIDGPKGKPSCEQVLVKLTLPTCPSRVHPSHTTS